MATPRVLILRAPGINCDEETAFAWESVGAKAEPVHVSRLCESPALLDSFQALTIPGGFSYGDDIASGKILANQLRHRLGDSIRRFIDRGGLVAGICNGFQVLVRMGLLPGDDCGVELTLALNESGRYEDRWVTLRGESDRCPFVEKGALYRVPVAHGEGRMAVLKTMSEKQRAALANRVALRYTPEPGSREAIETEHWREGEVLPFPINPNGSIENIAGLTDSTGRVFGLMPHPERCMFASQVPACGRVFSPENADSTEPDGLRMFRSAVRAMK